MEESTDFCTFEKDAEVGKTKWGENIEILYGSADNNGADCNGNFEIYGKAFDIF